MILMIFNDNNDNKPRDFGLIIITRHVWCVDISIRPFL